MNIGVVCNHLMKSNAEFDATELQTFSPIQLTAKGKEFIASTGFDKIFAEHKTSFFDLIDNEKPAFKYDVEQAAIKSIHLNAEKPFMGFLKVFFYNNPKRSLENTAPTLGIYIRDAYLNEHPQILT